MRLIYNVYDRDTEKLLFTGDYEEVCTRFNMSSSTISNIVSGHYSSKFPYIIKIKDSKENVNEIVDYLKRHLDKYGNTTINKKKKKYLKVLIEQGYKIKTKPSIYDKNSIIVELDKHEWY